MGIAGGAARAAREQEAFLGSSVRAAEWHDGCKISSVVPTGREAPDDDARSYLGICEVAGLIFVAPYNAEKFLIYDPSSSSRKPEALDLPEEVKGGERKFSALCKARGKDGKEVVAAAPRDADHLLIYDVAKEELRGVSVTDHAKGPRKFCGICQAGGKLVMAPMDAGKLLIYNLDSEVLSGLDITPTHLATGPQKFSAICEARGKVFAAPRCAKCLLIYDPSTEEGPKGIDISHYAAQKYKFSSICQAGGKVCLAPFGADCLLIYDLSKQELEAVYITAHVGRSPAKFSAICQAAGKVFAAPSHVNKLLICDPHTKEVECKDLLQSSRSTEFKFEDICEAGGWVLASPYNGDLLLAYNPATDNLKQLDVTLAVTALVGTQRKLGRICQVGGKVCAAPHNSNELLVVDIPVDLKEVELRDLERRMESRPFATGRFGDVYKAKLKDNALVAVKKPRWCSNLGEKDTWTFRNEARIMALVRHPNCMELLAVCRDNSIKNSASFMLISEFMETSLYHLLDREKDLPSVHNKLNWAAQAFEALSFLHSRSPSIIHGDIKPQNMLVDRNNVLKVADFGLSRIQSFRISHQSDGCAGGTRDYMAPELMSTRRNSTASDVYASGMVLHELAFGQSTEYEGELAQELYDRQVHEDYDGQHHEFPKGYFEVYCEALVKDPASRRPTAETGADKLVCLIKRGCLVSDQVDGFDGDAGKAGVISLVCEVRKWQWVWAACKKKHMHFRAVWPAEVEASGSLKDRSQLWKMRVSELAAAGKCGRMLVVTHDEERDGTRQSASMQNYEVRFLDEQKISYDIVTFTQFMKTYDTWN